MLSKECRNCAQQYGPSEFRCPGCGSRAYRIVGEDGPAPGRAPAADELDPQVRQSRRYADTLITLNGAALVVGLICHGIWALIVRSRSIEGALVSLLILPVFGAVIVVNVVGLAGVPVVRTKGKCPRRGRILLALAGVSLFLALIYFGGLFGAP